MVWTGFEEKADYLLLGLMAVCHGLSSQEISFIVLPGGDVVDQQPPHKCEADSFWLFGKVVDPDRNRLIEFSENRTSTR